MKKTLEVTVAIVYSLFAPGFGQIYAGKNKKGVCLLIIFILGSSTLGLGFFNQNAYTYVISSMIGLIFFAYTVINSVKLVFANGIPARKLLKKITINSSFIFIAVLLYIFLPKTFETFKQPAGSMMPTVMIGDVLLADYYFEINRGDVVVFKYPKDKNLNFIKRVIGVPGDSVEIINKEVYVNDKKIKLKEVQFDEESKISNEEFLKHNLKLYLAQLNKRSHQVIYSARKVPAQDNLGRIVIPSNFYFVLGDNRDFSSDSRYWGLVPKENIFAKPKFIYFTLSFRHPFKRFNKKIN